MPPCIDCNVSPSTLFYLVYLVYYVMMQGLFSRITNSMEKSEIFYSKFYEKVGVILAGSILFFFFEYYRSLQKLLLY